MRHQLKIENLALKVHLGWPEAERQALQTVRINVVLSFNNVPKAATTDELSDTICYAKMTDAILATLQQRSFKLLEHLGQSCYDIVAKHASAASKIYVSVTKSLGPEQGTRTFELFSE